MSYVVSGLPVALFEPFFGLCDDALAAQGIVRVGVTSDGFFPCRVLLEDGKPGESMLLLNYEHQPANTPYRARHAIFVNEAARETQRYVDRIPDILATRRLISLRAFDQSAMMIDADIVPGPEVETTALRMLANPTTAYIHAHNAARGCFAARIDRR